MLHHLLECPELAVGAITAETFLALRPTLTRLPLSLEHWVSNLVAVLPVGLQGHLVSEVEFGLLLVVLSFEWVDWACFASCVGQLHLVIYCPVLHVLAIEIQTLAIRRFVPGFLHCPIELVVWMSLKLRKLGTVHSQDLVAKLLGHVLDHFFGPPFFQNLFIHSHHILLLEGETGDAVLPLFDPSLAVHVCSHIFLELFLILQVVFLPLLEEQASCVNIWFINPFDCWVRKFFRVDVDENLVEATLTPLQPALFLDLLPGSSVSGILNELLRLVVIFECELLDLSHLGVSCQFLLPDVLPFGCLAMI